MVSKLPEIMKDNYGSLVILFLLTRNNQYIVNTLLDSIKNNIISLAISKNGSDIIEKCLEVASYVSTSLFRIISRIFHILY